MIRVRDVYDEAGKPFPVELCLDDLVAGLRPDRPRYAGSLLFAFCDSLALQAQTGGVVLPVETWSALPYVVTLVVLIITSRRRRAPRWASKQPVRTRSTLSFLGSELWKGGPAILDCSA